MKKVGAAGGFTPTLKKLVDTATQQGKQIGAPTLNKVLNGKGLHLGQLKKADRQQLRDLFERAPLTSKARALAEKLLQGTGPGPMVKVKADLPTTTPSTPPPVVKVKADLPTTTTPPVVKVKADLPTTTTPSTTPPVVKVKADLPTTTTTPPVVKVKADLPTF